jgi:hypothetical protein
MHAGQDFHCVENQGRTTRFEKRAAADSRLQQRTHSNHSQQPRGRVSVLVEHSQQKLAYVCTVLRVAAKRISETLGVEKTADDGQAVAADGQ